MGLYRDKKEKSVSGGEMDTQDYLVRATAANAQIRAFAVRSGNTVEEARKAHHTTPVATAALGRLMSGALMMGDMLKNKEDLLTIRVDGDGPLGGILVTADREGNVKGYVKNEAVLIPNRADNHLDVGGAVGKGTLTVIRDMGLKEPYTGQIPLYSGEIADDLTYYFAESEQIPSSVALGVLVSGKGQVAQSGGFLIQLMPGAEEEVISTLENRLKGIRTITEMLSEGMGPEDMLNTVLNGLDVAFNGRQNVRFYCNCSRERVERALMLLGRKELEGMVSDGEDTELKCHFCNKAYHFSSEELKKLAATL